MKPTPSNPLVSILNVIGLVLFVAVSMMLGFVLIAVILGLMAIVAGYVGFQRFRFGRQRSNDTEEPNRPKTVIDGEYRVLDPAQRPDERPDKSRHE